MTPTPVTIVTGFLGSGKTTLVNHVLAHRGGARTAVLVNELGAVGIDGALVVADSGDLVELSNGCVCCETNGDLLDATLRVLERPQPPERIIVETTGVADPVPVALAFLTPPLKDLTRLDAIVTLVDAEQFGADRFGRAARSQVAHGDVIVLNKCDLVGVERLAEVVAAVAAVKPGARVVRTTRARAALPVVLGAGAFDGKGVGSEPHRDADGFVAVTYEGERPFDLGRFQAFLDALPAAVFRAKGVLWFAGRDERCVFHLVGGRFTLERGPWAGPRAIRLVLIGQRLDAAALRRKVRECEAL